jgi:hypothetical protein
MITAPDQGLIRASRHLPGRRSYINRMTCPPRASVQPSKGKRRDEDETLTASILTGCLSAALLVIPASAAVVAHACVAAAPTSASNTWDFKGEANTIFQAVQDDAGQALDHADELQAFARDYRVSWDSHENQLSFLKEEVNDMGARLCRLETIRRVVAPWQQKEIDRIAAKISLMANETQGAILFGSAHSNSLWLGTYQKYTIALYGNAQSLAKSLGTAVAYGNVSKEYRELGSKL